MHILVTKSMAIIKSAIENAQIIIIVHIPWCYPCITHLGDGSY